MHACTSLHALVAYTRTCDVHRLVATKYYCIKVSLTVASQYRNLGDDWPLKEKQYKNYRAQ